MLTGQETSRGSILTHNAHQNPRTYMLLAGPEQFTGWAAVALLESGRGFNRPGQRPLAASNVRVLAQQLFNRLDIKKFGIDIRNPTGLSGHLLPLSNQLQRQVEVSVTDGNVEAVHGFRCTGQPIRLVRHGQRYGLHCAPQNGTQR